MEKIAIIGGGLSGLSVANILKEKHNVTIFEKDTRPGGLIKCERVNGNLYHICGGHVFNSKREDVLDWFWSFFNQEEEFIKADRNAVVFMEDGKKIPYPIENHAYHFDDKMLQSFIADLITLAKAESQEYDNFEDFLKNRFGTTLYKEYFEPYNKKIWKSNLSEIPLTWLEGKLPMPTVSEIIYSNIKQTKEKSFVHSTFWYEKNNGSQFIVDTLSKGLDIRCNSEIKKICRLEGKWQVENEIFDKVVFCGIIKDLPNMLQDIDIAEFSESILNLKSHGTTTVFCEIDSNDYSWIYLPSQKYDAHRIICTGNFAKTNNAEAHILTGTIEFTDYISKEDILVELDKMPLKPKYLKHTVNKFSYPVQDSDTREMIYNLKDKLAKEDFFLTGRFADWEYYNMDVAIGAAIDLCKKI
jgi:protoporphyrinogen oxidase